MIERPQTTCHSIEPSTSTHNQKKIDRHIISNIVFKLIRSHHSCYLDGSFLFIARPIDHFPGPHDNQRLSSNEYVTPIWVYCSDVIFFLLSTTNHQGYHRGILSYQPATFSEETFLRNLGSPDQYRVLLKTGF